MHKKFDLYEHEWASQRNTDWAEHVMKQYQILASETLEEELDRIKRQLCKRCSLGGGLAGQAFTSWECGICEKPQQHHNTACPKLCKECAKANELCINCGASVHFGKIKRKIKGHIHIEEITENSATNLEKILEDKLYE